MQKFQLTKHKGDQIIRYRVPVKELIETTSGVKQRTVIITKSPDHNKLPQFNTYKGHTAMLQRPIPLGISGSNTSDLSRDRKYCVATTLGFLVEDDTRQLYIVGTAHSLVGFDPQYNLKTKTQPGDIIAQPADLDFGCSITGSKNAVAKLTKWSNVTNNMEPSDIDIAIAEVLPGKVDPTGNIYKVGYIKETTSFNTATPTLNTQVKKSGRTTGLTYGLIHLTDFSSFVQYDDPQGKPFSVFLDDLIMIYGNNFSDDGDSGSLVISRENYPIGLLFAGTESITVAFPINRVIKKIETMLGKKIKIKGQNRSRKIEQLTTSDRIYEYTVSIKEKYKTMFALQNGFIGVGISKDDTGRYAIVAVVNESSDAAINLNIPKELYNVRIDLLRIKGPIKAL